MKQYDTDTRKILSALCHEALNFQITFFLYAIVFSFLIFIVIGIPLLIALVLLSFILPIIAIVRVASNPDVPYRYPFIFRLL